MDRSKNPAVLTRRNPESQKSSFAPSIIYTIAFLDLFAVSMLTPLLRKQSVDMGSSFTTAGLIGSIYGAVQLFSSPVVGDWSDHFGRNRVMFVTSLLAAVGYLIVSASSWTPFMFLGRIICGCFKHSQTLCKAYLADLQGAKTEVNLRSSSGESASTPAAGDAKRKPPKAKDNFGTFMAISSCGFIFGPIVGGHIAEYDNGFQIVAVLVAITFLTNAVIIRTLLPKLPSKHSPAKREKKTSHFTEVSAVVGTNWDAFLLQLLISFSVMVIRTNYVQYVQDNFNISIKWAGYLTSYQALLGVIGSACVSLPIMNRYQRNSILMLHTTVILGGSVLGIAYTSNFFVYLLCLTVLNFVSPFSRMANMTQLLQRSTSREHHGTLMGTSQSVNSFSRLSSSFVSGIAQDYSSHGPELLSVTCCLMAVVQILTMY